jgi:hypothetical protein
MKMVNLEIAENGHVDPKTGKDVFNAEYLEKVWGTEKQPEIITENIFSLEDIKESSIKEYGVNYLLTNIANSIGLINTLKSTLPQTWELIFTLASYMVASGEPAMYCEDWLNKTDGLCADKLTSQSFSALALCCFQLQMQIG